MMKEVVLWAGFVEGKLDISDFTDAYDYCKMPALFAKRSSAAKRYTDVRKITVSYEYSGDKK